MAVLARNAGMPWQRLWVLLTTTQPKEMLPAVPASRSSVKARTLEERTHKQFAELMGLISEGHSNLMMVGPAGSGKTTLARNVAKALSLDFGFISLSAGVTETHLFGRMLPQSDGTWGYQPSRFVNIYRNGGVFLFDELDAADGNVIVSVNAALANGVLCNPVTGEVIERHADCLIVTAANTFGTGGSTQYVGRNALDAATLDRFVLATLLVTYDTDLEADIAGSLLNSTKSNALLAWVGVLRGRVEYNRLRRVISTRLVVNAAKAMAKGCTLDDVKKRLFVSWSPDEIAKVEA
jgi:MoxR-like ATPase